MRIQREEKGITLIALIITIIVLLILSGVSIAMLTGENGILKRAEGTQVVHAQGELEEVIQLAIMESLTDREKLHTIENVLRIAVTNSYISLDDNAKHMLKNEETTDDNMTEDNYVSDGCTSIRVVDKENGVNVRIFETDSGDIQIEVGEVIDVANMRDINIIFEMDPNPDEILDFEEITITIIAKLEPDSSKKNSKITSIIGPNGESLEILEYEDENGSGDMYAVATYVVRDRMSYMFKVEEQNGGTNNSVAVVSGTNKIEYNVSPENYTNKNVVVTIKYDKNANISGTLLSNKDKFQYKINDEEYQTATINDEGYFEVEFEENGILYARYYYEEDWFGEIEIPINNIDKIPPIELSVSGTPTQTVINVSRTNAIDEESGLDRYEYILYDEEGEIINDWQSSATFTGLQEETIYKLQGRVFDNAGNVMLSELVEVETTSYPTLMSCVEAGDYVKYPNINGYTGVWRVLYQNKGGGVEIIPNALTTTYTLTGKTGYANAIYLLNEQAAPFLDSTYASSYRHLGSYPTAPSSNATVSSSSIVYNNYTTKDSYYTTDYKVLEDIRFGSYGSYWFASRYVTNSGGGSSFFQMNYYSGSLINAYLDTLVTVTSAGAVTEKSLTKKICPVIKLHATVKAVSGSGTSSSPWQIDI